MIDLPVMQKLAANNIAIRYLFVAVDALSCFLWVEPLNVDISQTCKEALMRIIVKNGKTRVPMIWSTAHQAEKISVDKGREVSGELLLIKRYCNSFHQTSPLAERNIRSLKSLISKYMLEHDSNTYIDQLDQFVSITNRRVNRMTKLAPASFSRKVVPYLVSLRQTSVLQ